MSYVRFSGSTGPHPYVSDVYILDSSACPGERPLECCDCQLARAASTDPFPCFDLAGMIAHLAEHQAAGHVVPDFVEKRLRADPPAPRWQFIR